MYLRNSRDRKHALSMAPISQRLAFYKVVIYLAFKLFLFRTNSLILEHPKTSWLL